MKELKSKKEVKSNFLNIFKVNLSRLLYKDKNKIHKLLKNFFKRLISIKDNINSQVIISFI